MSDVQIDLSQSYGSIEALPEHHSVVKGTSITYRLALERDEPELMFNWDGSDVPAQSPGREMYDKTGRTRQMIPHEVFDEDDSRTDAGDIGSALAWYVIYDHQGRGGPPYELVGRGRHTVKIKWKHPGQHVVLCQIGYRHANKRAPLNELADSHILFTQHVGDIKTVQKRRMRRQKKRDLPNPFEEIDALEKYLDAIKAAEKEHGCPASKRKAYEADIRKRERYLDRLVETVRPVNRRMVTPIHASYVARNRSEQIDLRVCIQERFEFDMESQKYNVWLIDWTNPLDDRLRGRYYASAETRTEAIKKVIDDWRENNEYYHPGNVVVEFPAGALDWQQPARTDQYTFNTPGKGVWGKIQEFLEAIALALSVAAAVVTMVVPVPGSRVVSGMIWASIFTSSAAAGIGIGRRKRNGFSNWNDDAFDVLTIVGNVFSAGRMGWARRAVLSSRRFAGQFHRFCLYGEVSTDAVQGLLIAEEQYSEFESILNDPDLSPKERVDKMLEFARSGIASQAISFASVRGSKRRGRRHDVIEPEVHRRLQNPGETIDLDDIKKQRGTTAAGGIKTRVEDEPARARSKQRVRKKRKSRRRGKFDFPEAPHPHERGMRAVDDFDFEESVLKSDNIVLVRDSNQAMLRHVNDPRKGPKPLSLKAKTLQSGPNAGLAAADPNDPRLKELLADSKSSRTGKSPMPYDEFVDELKSKGFEVSGPENNYVITSKSHPGGYYSDYDLHGVYTKQGRGAYSEAFRGELNERLGKELVQHGPHDEWPMRNSKEAGPNRGPQPPVTAYVPVNGVVKKLHLKSVSDMREFYEAWNIPWKSIYPGR